jgi:hypothetical protein
MYYTVKQWTQITARQTNSTVAEAIDLTALMTKQAVGQSP